MENLSATEALWLVLVLVALPFWALNLQFAVRDYLSTRLKGIALYTVVWHALILYLLCLGLVAGVVGALTPESAGTGGDPMTIALLMAGAAGFLVASVWEFLLRRQIRRSGA